MRRERLQNYLSEHLLVLVILLNLAYLVINLLLYDPVWRADDYYIAANIYGVYLDEYDANPIYTTALYGHLVTFFLNICGDLPWYTILSYTWVFASLCLLSYVILLHNRTKISWVIVNLIILFFSFEGYMCMQWTKTSAIAIGTGMFALVFPTKNKWIKPIAVALFLVGAFFRTANVLMVIGSWGVTFGILSIYYFLKKNYDLCKSSIVNISKVVVLYLVFQILLNMTNIMFVEKSEELDKFQKWTSYRSQVQDYAVPEYNENKEIYIKYGITQEDIEFIYQWGFDVYNYELYENISLAIEEINQQNVSQVDGGKWSVLIEKIVDSFHTFPISFLKMDVFYCYIILVIILLYYSKKENGGFLVGFTFALLMGLNIYLFVKGRYLKHRVDVAIIFTICLILVYLFMHYRHDFIEKSVSNKMIFIILLLLIITPVRMFTDDRHTVSQTDIANNKVFYANASEDKHFYLFVNTRSENDRKSYGFDIYDTPQIGLMKNTFGLIMATPKVQDAIESLGIEDPYLDVIDGTNMYLVTGESDSMLQEVLKYIEKKSGKSVYIVCVKEFLGKSIYRVNSKDITDVYDFTNVSNDIISVNQNIQTIVVNGRLNIAGSVYIEGENDFYQNIYIDVVDSQSEEHQLFYTLQTLNQEYEMGESGWCSNISANVNLPEFYDESDAIYLIIETLDITYRYQISVNVE